MPTNALVPAAAVCASLETLDYLLQHLPSKMRNSPRLAKNSQRARPWRDLIGLNLTKDDFPAKNRKGELLTSVMVGFGWSLSPNGVAEY